MTTTTRQPNHSEMRLRDIHPSPENDKLYAPVNPDAPSIIALAKSIRKHGLREPIVVTLDCFILSGQPDSLEIGASRR